MLLVCGQRGAAPAASLWTNVHSGKALYFLSFSDMFLHVLTCSFISPSFFIPSVLLPSVLLPSVLPPSVLPPSVLPPSVLPPSVLPPSVLFHFFFFQKISFFFFYFLLFCFFFYFYSFFFSFFSFIFFHFLSLVFLLSTFSSCSSFFVGCSFFASICRTLTSQSPSTLTSCLQSSCTPVHLQPTVILMTDGFGSRPTLKTSHVTVDHSETGKIYTIVPTW